MPTVYPGVGQKPKVQNNQAVKKSVTLEKVFFCFLMCICVQYLHFCYIPNKIETLESCQYISNNMDSSRIIPTILCKLTSF